MSRLFDTVFLDADNTLFDFDATSQKALTQSFAEFGVSVTDDNIALYRRINKECWDQYNQGLIENSQINPLRWQRWVEQMQLSDNLDAQALAAFYQQSLTLQCEKEPGADELMAYLFRHYKVHIITNGFPEVQAHRWHKAGWQEQLTGITVSSVVGVKKPDAAIYNIAMQSVGVTQPERCLMIGDDIQADVAGSQAVGMQACWYARKGAQNQTDIQPDFQVSHLSEIIDFL